MEDIVIGKMEQEKSESCGHNNHCKGSDKCTGLAQDLQINMVKE